MSKTSTLNIGVSITGDGTSGSWAPRGGLIQNTTAPDGGTFPIALTPGNNTIPVPAGATGFACQPPASSSNAKTMKGIGGDTGLPMGRARATIYLFDETVPAPSTIVVNSVGSETVDWLWL